MNAMMATQPRVTANDRLSLTLFVAAAVHGIVILGLGFEYSYSRAKAPNPTVDVVLVQTRADTTPEKAELIAQADQIASGRDDPEGRPSSPLTSPMPLPTDGLAQEQVMAASPDPVPSEAVELITSVSPDTPSAPEQIHQTPTPQRDLSARELVERSLEMARLSSELAEVDRYLAPRARTHYVDALSAKSAVEAAYVDAWVRKVEQVGNLNYPDEARRRRLNGSLILSVLIGQEGQVISIEIGASSGERVLDDAARRIVELAGPYAPFPAEMRRSYDQLMITRTWVFQGNQGVRTR
ncbi:energy transducer TonB [Ectothiorhodospira shaposhnikovii]|uniref:energy transducer TonB n=1 Tax=Ectothiorhodospira shaposhnikovii TaxID=1054 RepID=UPI0019086131|nr:TonB family protein [Ectothiorhodospira shaposhnikovii]MBK1672089.1 energy transducer TonB [Ectothiorhodospira shaposhnikovii]